MKCEKCGHENKCKPEQLDLKCPSCGKDLALETQSPSGYFGQPTSKKLVKKKPKKKK
jgi:ribosomal protein S27E